ncbi:hypothetical protein D3C87_1668340 [compost metagenome]
MEATVGIVIGLLLLAVLAWGIHYSVIADRGNRNEDDEDIVDQKSSITQAKAGNPTQKAPDARTERKRRDQDREL